MDTNPNTNSEPNLTKARNIGRKNTKQIGLLLAFTFICLVVSVILGISNNIPSAIGSLLLILAFTKLAEYNPSDLDNALYHKYFWVLFLIAGVMFVFAIKAYVSSFVLFDSDFGLALMWIGLGVYFVCLKPSKTSIGLKILKALGYILLSVSVESSYICSNEFVPDMFLCIFMFVLGAVSLYFGNRPYLKELFNQ